MEPTTNDELVQLRFLHEINLEIAEAESYHAALQQALRAFRRELGAACGEAWVLSLDGTQLMLMVLQHDGQPEFRDLEDELRSTSPEMGSGAVGMAWRSGVPYLSVGAAAPVPVESLRDAHSEQPDQRSVFAIPIRCAGDLMSVFGLHLLDPPDRSVLERLSSIAPELGGYLWRKREEQDAQFAAIIVEQSPTVLYQALAIEGAPRIYTSSNVIRFGYTVEECKLGKFHFPNFVHPEDRNRVIAEVERVLGAGGDHFELEYRLVTADNQVRYIIDRTKGLRDENGDFKYWQGVLTDVTERWEAEEQLKLAKAALEREKKLSDDLLLNILPAEIADELKATGTTAARLFDQVTVMFTDFKGFTPLAEQLSPSELVAEIHSCFKEFDAIVANHNLEKIKTIGDAYMCAGGIPVATRSHAHDAVSAALEIRDFMREYRQVRAASGHEGFQIRIGIHTGPVVAGVVGVKKFAYDIWGDTVNTASRMESSGEAGLVNISATTYELVRDNFDCVHRGQIAAKNKGRVDMYFVETRASRSPGEVRTTGQTRING